jgi:hypothetical protein
VGEAPVSLRADEYEKITSGAKGSVFNLLVNHLGDVCVAKLDKPTPKGGVVFATAAWLPSYAQDSEGYPTFQGVRGVCAKISTFASSAARTITEDPLNLVHSTLRAIKVQLAGGDEPTIPVRKLMEKRLQLIAELTNLKRSGTLTAEMAKQIKGLDGEIEKLALLIKHRAP